MKIIQIVGWNSKQSYTDRRPSWVKLHRTLLDSFEFHQMCLEAKAMLPMFWLLASENEDPKAGYFEYNVEIIAFRLRVSTDLVKKALSDCQKLGFLQVIDSNDVSETLQNHTKESRFDTGVNITGKVKKNALAQVIDSNDVSQTIRNGHTETETEKETDTDTDAETEKETEGDSVALGDTLPSLLDQITLPKNQVEKAVDLWQKMAAETGVPKIRGMTDDRKKKLRLRLRDIGGIDAWAEAMDKIRESQFCQGKNEKGWQISFTKILEPRILTNLLEGVYADKPKHLTSRPLSESERVRLKNEEFDRHLAALEGKMRDGND